jgi:hypothetical protein
MTRQKINQETKKSKRLQLYVTIGKYGLPATFIVGCFVYLVVGLWNINK